MKSSFERVVAILITRYPLLLETRPAALPAATQTNFSDRLGTIAFYPFLSEAGLLDFYHVSSLVD